MALSERQTSPPSLMHLTFRSAANLLAPLIIRGFAGTSFATREFSVSADESTGSVRVLPRREETSNGCPLPASKASIGSLQRVEVSEAGLECPICLVDYEVGMEVKEMPCRHKFHSGCIDRWLGIHRSCPICRFELPVENKGSGNKRGSEEVTLYVRVARRIRRRSSDPGMELRRVEDLDLEGNYDNGREDDNYDLIVQGIEMEFSN